MVYLTGNAKSRDELVKLMKIMEKDGLTLAEVEEVAKNMHNLLTNVNCGMKVFHSTIPFKATLGKEELKVSP